MPAASTVVHGRRFLGRAAAAGSIGVIGGPSTGRHWTHVCLAEARTAAAAVPTADARPVRMVSQPGGPP